MEMEPQLQSLTVENFRSILGGITVPLNAPVVLIHGPNGAGKTSLLAALELALTGTVASMQHAEPGYQAHLVHKDADAGRVAVRAAGVDVPNGSLEATVAQNRVITGSMLAPRERRFFTERCFLAQSSLSRLLEIYEPADARKRESPLAAFMKELLGLDRLDALVDGLHDAGNIRRLHSEAPGYDELRDQIRTNEERRAQAEDEQRRRHTRIASLELEVATMLSDLGIAVELHGDTLESVGQLLDPSSEEGELQRVATLRRELQAVEAQWVRAQTETGAVTREHAEVAVASMRQRFDAWKRAAGTDLDQLFRELGGFFQAIPTPDGTSPAYAVQEAIKLLAQESQRCEEVLQGQEDDVARAGELETAASQLSVRAAELDAAIGERATDTSEIAASLSAILSVIEDDVCPICERNFGEVSGRSLKTHVEERIQTLTERANELNQLAQERSAVGRRVAEGARERSAGTGASGVESAP
jgi:DNA repair protein SbcC/Rad50